jgi:hypothetical protein
MPTVNNPAALKQAYQAARTKIAKREIPTLLIQGGQPLFRSVPTGILPKPAAGGHVSKGAANKILVPYDLGTDRGNRFSGPSHSPGVPSAGGVYCVLQQQALINESMHYSGNPGNAALDGKCVLRMRVMGALLVADLSPHNPGSRRFLDGIGSKTWDKMNDSGDCSVARGIGLAIADSGFLHGLSVQTVRTSERSAGERGDNLVLFSTSGPVAQIYIDEAYYYAGAAAPQQFAIEFP